MKMIQIPGTDLTVSALCQGLGAFGTAISGEAADQLYQAFRDGGGNFFDTAHCYSFWAEGGLGGSERALGKCIRRHGDLGKVVIATKGGHPDAGEGYRRPDKYLSPEVIASDLNDSLERLAMGCVDLYLLHRDDARVPVGEIVDMLSAEATRGRIRFAGASNWSIRRIAEANRYAAEHGLKGFVISQPQWSLAHPNGKPPTSDPAMRYLMPDDVAWHAAQKLPVMAYSSTGGGYFATGGKTCAAGFDNPISRGRLERAGELADKLGRSVNQVALAYLMNQEFVAIPILGTHKLDHLADALSAAEVHFDAEQVRWLRDG